MQEVEVYEKKYKNSYTKHSRLEFHISEQDLKNALKMCCSSTRTNEGNTLRKETSLRKPEVRGSSAAVQSQGQQESQGGWVIDKNMC